VQVRVREAEQILQSLQWYYKLFIEVDK
jgi:hypothetical protein